MKIVKKSDEEILNDVKTEYERIQPKTEAEFFSKAKGIPSHVYLKKKFKTSWWGLKRLIGKEEGNKYSRKTRKEYLDLLKELTEELGHPPCQNEFCIHTGMSTAPIYRIFGGFVQALKEAGFNAHSPVCVEESRDQLIDQYREFSLRLGKQASVNELNGSKQVHGAGVYYLRFESMAELKEKAGFVPNLPSRNKYTKQEILDLLKVEYLKGNKPLSTNELMNNLNLPSKRTILKYFKTTSIKTVWEEVQRVDKKSKDMEETLK
ncbi:homing endonuclease associated repeat-containing protein [Desulfosporosinus hippei]|uniref:Uncharacterized protein n=1 Tax=Desulfosporosinus hippei DSM 8344 TaxID=1121419 RepID=A0A1G8CFW3_9FIRM|nr:hypothetical protein [Desulfosporosinus hippei]SDH44394.1 hypothetical protein SAMN05443529_11391 [Desulfosporosinus hippei DSM 8344]